MLGPFHASLKAKGSGAKGWANSWTEVEHLGDGKFVASIGVGHRVFNDKTDGTWKKHKLTDERPTKDHILIQSAQCCVEVYPFYARYFDVHHEEIRLHEERWVVQWLFKEPDTWRDVGAYNPVIEVEELPDAIKVTVAYDTDYGPLIIEYLQKDACPLKHNVFFTNTSGPEETFRVVQKWTGIVGSKCNGKNIPLVEDASFLAFHRADRSKNDFNIAENLWEMIFNPDGSKKTEHCLQEPITVESHAQGMKTDFIYGFWTLAQNESLTIDPSTYSNSNPAVDGHVVKSNTGATYGRDTAATLLFTGPSVGSGGNTYRFFVEWNVAGIPNNAIISDTDFKFHCWYDRSGRVSGIFEMDERPLTQGSDSILWNHIGSLTQYVAYNGFVPSAGINKTQDLGAAADADLEAALAVDWFAIGARMSNEAYDPVSHKYEGIYAEEYAATPDPTLYVTYTVPVAPTVTTQAATGLTVGAGTLHGTITATGGENADERGFDWDYDSGAPYAYEETDLGDFGTGAFEEALSGLTQGNTVYFRGKAHNSAGWGYGGELNFVVRKSVERSASAAVGLVGATDRQFVGTRSSPGAIGVTGVSGRAFVGERVASASFSMVSVAGRIKILVRSASITLGMVGATDRVLHAFRSEPATIGMIGTSSRSWIGTRPAAASISIVGVSARSWIGTRAASAALGITGVAGRLLHAFRSAGATINAVGAATRSWIGSRGASASLGVSAVATGIKGVIRSASASMGIVGTAARSWVGTRPASAEISVAGAAKRSWVGSRSAPATMGVVGTSARMLHSIRSASASLSQIATAVRSGVFTRSASGDMTIQGTAIRSWIGSRTATASMAVTGVADRIINRVRSASASMSQVAVASRVVVFIRTASGDISMQGTPSRMLASVRSAAASISSSATARRTLFAKRAASASIAITGVTERMLSAIRSASASVNLTAASERMLAAFRSASAAITATAVGGFIGRVIGGAVTLQLAGKTRLLDFVGKEQTLTLSLKSAVLNLADKIRKLELGRKET